MHNYKNLKIWDLAMDLAAEVYSLTNQFPNQEKYGLTNQLRRAAVSIPSNIAEGTSRASQKEFKHFLNISIGSSFEVTTQLELAYRLDMIKNDDKERLLKTNDLLQRQIHSFSKQLN